MHIEDDIAREGETGEAHVDYMTGKLLVDDKDKPRIMLMLVEAACCNGVPGIDVQFNPALLADKTLLPALIEDVRKVLDKVEAHYLTEGGAK